MVTCNDTREFPGRNPKKWKIFGKLNPNDQWIQIENRSLGGYFGAKNFTEYWFGIYDYGELQYFRLEISEVEDGQWMQLSEFMFGN